MSCDQLSELSEVATPGSWAFGSAPHPDSDETKAAYQARTLVGGDEPLWVVHAQDGSRDVDYVVPAITGDGPTSRANAEFIVALVNAYREGALVPANDVTLAKAEAAAWQAKHETLVRDVEALVRTWREDYRHEDPKMNRAARACASEVELLALGRLVRKEPDPCGKGPCSANEGHDGTCDEASGHAEARGQTVSDLLVRWEREGRPVDHVREEVVADGSWYEIADLPRIIENHAASARQAWAELKEAQIRKGDDA